jgi:NADH dehydrogenase/NADH:ubiquinone oxidoreductase subunit G
MANGKPLRREPMTPERETREMGAPGAAGRFARVPRERDRITMPRLTINNMPVEVEPGTTILEAANRIGIKIPTMCYLAGVQCLGACRVCLVELKGSNALVASCSMPVQEGMEVLTNTARVRDARRTVVGLMLSEHDGDCQTCERNKDCELQTLAYELNIRETRYPAREHTRTLTRRAPRWCATTASVSSVAGV